MVARAAEAAHAKEAAGGEAYVIVVARIGLEAVQPVTIAEATQSAAPALVVVHVESTAKLHALHLQLPFFPEYVRAMILARCAPFPLKMIMVAHRVGKVVPLMLRRLRKARLSDRNQHFSRL